MAGFLVKHEDLILILFVLLFWQFKLKKPYISKSETFEEITTIFKQKSAKELKFVLFKTNQITIIVSMVIQISVCEFC
jgi:hypothetical protein